MGTGSIVFLSRCQPQVWAARWPSPGRGHNGPQAVVYRRFRGSFTLRGCGLCRGRRCCTARCEGLAAGLRWAVVGGGGVLSVYFFLERYLRSYGPLTRQNSFCALYCLPPVPTCNSPVFLRGEWGGGAAILQLSHCGLPTGPCPPPPKKKHKRKNRPLAHEPPGPLPVETRDACPRGRKMPGPSPQSHDASGWGSSKMGTASQWHCERAPLTSRNLSNPPPSPPSPPGGRPPPPPSTSGGFPPQKGEHVRTPGSTNSPSSFSLDAPPPPPFERAPQRTELGRPQGVWNRAKHISGGAPWGGGLEATDAGRQRRVVDVGKGRGRCLMRPPGVRLRGGGGGAPQSSHTTTQHQRGMGGGGVPDPHTAFPTYAERHRSRWREHTSEWAQMGAVRLTAIRSANESTTALNSTLGWT